jgi:hypothetical protein
MSIVIDQVEGVVQREAESQPSAVPATGGAPPQPAAEAYDEQHRRAERLVHRLHAD